MTKTPALSDHSLQTHYAHANLSSAIRAALAESNLSPATITRTDLSPVDEFHVGGHRATTALFTKLAPTTNHHVLDVGCGIGGPARHVADTFGCHVTGIDLSHDYIACGTTLNAWLGLDDKVTLIQGTALDMPVADASIDLAYMLHVGMNITDKAALMREIARILAPGGRLAIYDIMQCTTRTPTYPLPWADHDGLSALGTPTAYRDALAAAGLAIDSETDHTSMAVNFFKNMATAAPKPLGLHLLMGQTAPTKIKNLARQIGDGILAPIEIIAVKSA